MQIGWWQENNQSSKKNNQSSKIWHNSTVFLISSPGGGGVQAAGFKPMTERHAHTQASDIANHHPHLLERHCNNKISGG